MPVPTKTPTALALAVGQGALGIGDRPVRGDHRELADAVEHAQLRRLEVFGAVEPDGRAERRRQAIAERQVEAVDRRATGARRLEHLGGAVAERRDHADAGDRDAVHRRIADCG